MALKSSLLWFRRNWRKTSSRFFTSRGPWTTRADFCRETNAESQSWEDCLVPRPSPGHTEAARSNSRTDETPTAPHPAAARQKHIPRPPF